MRISDWSSDVCSSDLAVVEAKDNVGIHLNEPTIAVPGKTLVARCGSKALNRLIVKAKIKDSVHHARHGHTRAGTDGYKQRRSEEHTSELQSLMRISYAVFCLKKKNSHNI